MILRVRDNDGNVQEILVIRGENYVLTEADKVEIAGMISEGSGDSAAVTAHLSNKGNPHGVTCSQIGAVTQTELESAVATALNNANIAYVGTAAPANDVGKDGDIYIVSG